MPITERIWRLRINFNSVFIIVIFLLIYPHIHRFTRSLTHSLITFIFLTTAITSSVAILIFFIAYSFIWSLICNNVSKVDQIWSITPGVYCCHYLYIFYAQESSRGREPVHQRLALITGLVVLWGVRLTYNFWRRGG